MTTAADIFDECLRYVDYAMLSMPESTPPIGLLTFRASQIAMTVVLHAAHALRERRYDVACDLVLLGDKECLKVREALATDEGQALARSAIDRANARARATGQTGYVSPDWLLSQVMP